MMLVVRASLLTLILLPLIVSPFHRLRSGESSLSCSFEYSAPSLTGSFLKLTMLSVAKFSLPDDDFPFLTFRVLGGSKTIALKLL